MSRIIDADALKDRLQEALEFQEKHDNYEGAELFEIAQDIVDEQHTINAIPIEWLKAQIAPYRGDVSDIGKGAHNATIKNLIYKWQNEHGAR